MPRYHKWLTGAAADAPADEVARRAVAERLRAVCHFLDRSLGGADEAEAIHQLRVWTRRAGAALQLFAPAIPRSGRKRLKKTLRKLRTVAGAVRDCDVQLAQLHGDPALPARVLRTLQKQRRQARQELKSLRRKLQQDDRFARKMERLIAQIAWPKRHSSRQAPSFGAFGRQALGPLVQAFSEAAAADLSDDEALHAARIAGKRLRYALELAPALLPPSTHRRLYDSLSEIQDRFGAVHDQLTVCAQIGAWLETANKRRQEKKLAQLLKRAQRRLQVLRRALLRWWSPARQKRLARQWQRALSAG